MVNYVDQATPAGKTYKRIAENVKGLFLLGNAAGRSPIGRVSGVTVFCRAVTR